MSDAPFHRGDVLVWILPGCVSFCFVAASEPYQADPEKHCMSWDLKAGDWVYGARRVEGAMRLATSEDLQRWLNRLSDDVNKATDRWLDAKIVYQRWLEKQR